MKLKTKLIKLGRNPKKQKGFINPGIYKGSTMIFNNFKDYSSTGPGVTTGGNVELGKCSHLGIGSTVKHQILIGDNTIIGSQSMVLKNCNKDSIYYGIPAKKIRNRKDNSKYL